MMHQVVQVHLPVRQKARSAKKGLALKAEFPVFFPRLVRRALQCTANFSCAFIENTYKLLGRFERHRLVAALGEIELRSGQDAEAKTRKQIGRASCRERVKRWGGKG